MDMQEVAVLAEGGTSAYSIVVPDGAHAAVMHAGQQLQRYFAESTGARLPLVAESAPRSGPSLFVGPCQASDFLKDDAGFRSLGEDGILLRRHERNVHLLGSNRRGVLYAVYEFLERCLGIRFLAHDCTVVPRHPAVSLPVLEVAYTPPFFYRETLYYDSFDPAIALPHRLNGPFCRCDEDRGGKWVFHPYVHSFAKLIPPERYYAEHPEYFSLINGRRVGKSCDAQLCLSNPEVLKVATDRVLQWIEEHPQVRIFDVSQNDGGGPCECEACMAVVREEGSQHGPILRFVNAIADVVAERYPDRWIETLAYHYGTQPPARVRPRPNVIIRLCHVGNYFRGFEEDDRGSGFHGYLREWTSLTPHVFVWHYATNFGHYLGPNQNLMGLARDIQAYARFGVRGLMVQANYQSPGGELAELRQYLAARLMWDPARDPAAIREEFCRGYYGGAAEAVLDLLALMDRQVGQAEERPKLVGYANWDPAETVEPGFVAEAMDRIEAARRAATATETAHRIDRLLLPFLYMRLRYPGRYGLRVEEAPESIRRARDIAARNGITQVREVVQKDGMSEIQTTLAPWLEQMQGKFTAPAPPVVYDLYYRMDDARLEDCLVWRADVFPGDDGPRSSIFHHPPETGAASATYAIALPPVDGAHVVLRFDTGFTAPTDDGVRFSVLVDDQEIWWVDQTTMAAVPHTVDLGQWSGAAVRLTLRVDPKENMTLDWAHWIEPRIELELAPVQGR